MRQLVLPVAVALLALGPWGVARADDPVPASCGPNPAHVVTPGCAPALRSEVEEAVAGPVLEPGTTLPNLVPDAFHLLIFRRFDSIDPETGEFIWRPPELYFDTLAVNRGPVPLDVQSDEPTNSDDPSISQCVSWTTDFACRARRAVTGFELHQDHFHFHFHDFARYELRALLLDGTPDWSASGLLGTTRSSSPCFGDSLQADEGARPVPRYVSCGGPVSGISPGWADMTNYEVEGHNIPIDALPDGRYAFVMFLDEANHILEADDTDNRLVATIEISNDRHDVEVVARSWS